MRKFLCGRLREYGRACRLNLKDTGWGMKLVVLVITGFFCGALASEYFGTKLIFFAGGVFLGDMLLMVAVCLLSRFVTASGIAISEIFCMGLWDF